MLTVKEGVQVPWLKKTWRGSSWKSGHNFSFLAAQGLSDHV